MCHFIVIITCILLPEVIARQLALALNQNSIEKALQCIDSIGVLKKPDVKFQITYAVDERVAKPSMYVEDTYFLNFFACCTVGQLML